jgi:serine/threonine protein kinase
MASLVSALLHKYLASAHVRTHTIPFFAARTATSEVVCATDTRSGAPVLLKKCAKGGEGPARKRLECERRLLAKLDSPFIVRLLASFEVSSRQEARAPLRVSHGRRGTDTRGCVSCL